jgi:hypothetical protein
MQGKMKNAYNILDGYPYWKSPLVRTSRRCEVNIKMDVKENGW